jgi:HD-like signal output (HDOD) protein
MAKQVPLEELIKSIRSVPVAPEILPRLQSRLLDVNTDVADLGVLIKLDAGLTASVLRVSNSAYYAREEKVTSVEDAVSFIGYQETMRLVARCSYSTVMKGTLSFYGISGEQLWEEAVLSAFAMEHLCDVLGADVSEGYVAGLLHAIGMVAINDYLVRQGQKPTEEFGDDRRAMAAWEKEAVGWHHGEVGAAMMRQWRFAPAVSTAVERQFVEQIDANESLLSCLLPIAVSMALHLRNEFEEQNDMLPDPEFDLVRGERAGVDYDELLNMLDTVRQDWAKMREALV